LPALKNPKIPEGLKFRVYRFGRPVEEVTVQIEEIIDRVNQISEDERVFGLGREPVITGMFKETPEGEHAVNHRRAFSYRLSDFGELS
jgi:hypothetical protein